MNSMPGVKTMGDNSSSAALLNATPPGIVAIEGLRLGKTILTQAQYRQVVAVTEFYDLCCDERQGATFSMNATADKVIRSVVISSSMTMSSPAGRNWWQRPGAGSH
ncbi:hypothetical protein [Rhodococcus koreensis]